MLTGLSSFTPDPRLRLLAGREEKPRREATSSAARSAHASQASSSRVPSAEWVDLGKGTRAPVRGLLLRAVIAPGPSPLPENPAPSSSASVSHPSSPQACREGERRQLVDTELVRIGRVMTGHPSHPAPALALTPTSCHPAIPRRSPEHSHPLIPPPACHFLCSNVTLSARLP